MNLIRIKKISEKKDITLKSLCERINMSYQNLNRCIRENKISANDLEKISDVLEVPVSYFFEEENDRINNGLSNVANGNTNSTVTINEKEYNVKVLMERIKGLEAQLAAKNETIEILKNK